MRSLVVLATVSVLLTACSTRALRSSSSDDLWEGYASPEGAAFLGYHDRAERPAALPGG